MSTPTRSQGEGTVRGAAVGNTEQSVNSLQGGGTDTGIQPVAYQGRDLIENVGRVVDPGKLANGLGWFSIGLGLSQIAIPGLVAKLIGVRDNDKNRAVMRGVGIRELAAGIGILTKPKPTE